MTPRILTIGSSYIDLLYRVPKMPNPGEYVTGDDIGISSVFDGQGLLTAITLAKLGAKTALCTRLGQDIHGQRIYTTCQQNGIDVSSVIADPRVPTGQKIILSTGERSPRILLYPNANSYLSKDSVSEAFTWNPDALVINFDVQDDLIIDSAKRAYDRNIPVILNLSPAKPSFPFGSLPMVDIVCVNEQEIASYTSFKLGGADATLKVLLDLNKKIPANYYVLHTQDRGTYTFDTRRYQLSSPFACKPLDMAAFEEAFVAALALEYTRTRKQIQPACKFANAVATLVLSRPGTTASLPSEEEVETFLATNNTR